MRLDKNAATVTFPAKVNMNDGLLEYLMVSPEGPVHESLFAGYPVTYYWTCYQSEWATDISIRRGGRSEADHAVAGATRHAQLFQR